MFLHTHLANKIKKISTVDISAEMLKVGQEHFGFNTEGTNIESITGDAYEIIDKCETKGEADVIIVDINYSEDDKTISPPWKFLETEFLQKIADSANPESAYIVFNVLYYSDEAKQRVLSNFRALTGFDSKTYLEMEGDFQNKIFMLSRNKGTNFKNNNPTENTKLLETMLKNLEIKEKSLWLNEMNMKSHHEHI